ncbi:unnamed protein product [Peronospora belbahrii]|uniref:WRKY19-like zinc finger domain-containing protein n=1 Tax=Peronospora belbahrii TaxID=622444 RepID=A0ABN8CQQ0_9STRA|nr:unnamed protein product [Peronospora belbahrii]
MKTPVPNGPNITPGLYFHHFLDRHTSGNNNLTHAMLFNPSPTFGENVSSSFTHPSSAKRPRSNNTINNINISSSSSSFPSPVIGYSSSSSPPFEPDRVVSDFNPNWGFTSRNVSRNTNTTNWMSSSLGSSNITHNNSTTTTSSVTAGIGSPNGASTYIDTFLPDCDSTLYSLWSAPGSSTIMGSETENETVPNQEQQVQAPLYLASDDELKMDYPQLSEFNQDLDSYLNDTIDSGGPSPTTPLETSITNSVVKTDQVMNLDRRGMNNRESQLEMLLAPTTATEYLMKQDRGTIGMENQAETSTKRLRGGYNDVNSTMEPKQRGTVMPSLVLYHSGSMSTSATKTQAGGNSSGIETLTSVITPTSTALDTMGVKTGKRPRSRQCEFSGCQNRARSHQKCKKHGGAHQCVYEGCTKNSQSRGLCIAHGGGSRCKKEGCVRAAQSKGLCKSHGGGEYCAVEGCNKKAHLKHLCRTHGGGVRCKFEKCSKWAQRKGWCMAHAKEFAASR